MCRRTKLALPAQAESAAAARRFLAATCRRWELDELRDDLLLAVSELVTNSVIHARTPIAVNVAVAADTVEVGVQDHDPRPPVLRAHRPDLIADLDVLSERLPSFHDHDPRHPSLWVGEAGSVVAGRGLQLLSAVSDAWGVATYDESTERRGKEVWFTHAVPQTWPYRSRCECGPSSTVRTASGRGVVPLPGPWDD
jgi:Histidine kinase-like ATPase domain